MLVASRMLVVWVWAAAATVTWLRWHWWYGRKAEKRIGRNSSLFFRKETHYSCESKSISFACVIIKASRVIYMRVVAFFWFGEGLSWLMHPRPWIWWPAEWGTLKSRIYSPCTRTTENIQTWFKDQTARTINGPVYIYWWLLRWSSCGDWWHPDDSIALVCVSRVWYCSLLYKRDLDKNSRLVFH